MQSSRLKAYALWSTLIIIPYIHQSYPKWLIINQVSCRGKEKGMMVEACSAERNPLYNQCPQVAKWNQEKGIDPLRMVGE